MNIAQWENYTLWAQEAQHRGDHVMSMAFYQQALAQAMMADLAQAENSEWLSIKVISCHNLAEFWRQQNEPDLELHYLQLAQEAVSVSIPHCQHQDCDTYVENLGCCKAALVNYLKRHPNPLVAQSVQHLHSADHCQLIARFQLQ
ncbi:hypothetical protein VST7929_02807 [Vibrio stylophorae]|uniref:DUF2753 domain-containing protein n=1 Tax=Vibrio stylophorae TaxID=659351 RepID=A0ABM8ZWZ8_9VIBR|nr:DUF2753 family protein [Vibrio stylophorae]CAH0535146.1 hypothetical protein VST7929_02807 [Vibrio stylophorae]